LEIDHRAVPPNLQPSTLHVADFPIRRFKHDDAIGIGDRAQAWR